MSRHSNKRPRGFSLLEMTIAMAVGTIVLGAAVQLYTQGVQATWTASQRAEMQSDFRAASNMLTTDLSLAGAGLTPGAAISLPATTTPRYGCDQSNCYLNGVAGTYPLQGATPYLYGLLPGYDLGPILNTAQGATDVVTIIYTDSNFYLNCYIPTITAGGQAVIFSEPVSPATWSSEGCLPNGVATPQAVNDPAAGLTTGDLVLMTLGGTPLVVEVTGAVAVGTDTHGNPTYTVPFANNDALKMNQTAAGKGLNTVATGVAGTSTPAPCGQPGPCRVLVITYYIDNTITPPRLMRQVSGHTPMPVAENVAYLKFSYDMFNDSTSTPAVSCPSPGASTPACNSGSSVGLLPNQITKINILNFAIDSTLMGSQYGLTSGYQRLDLQTSVCARNLTYVNDFPN
jgi:prepilin-type N-terminal cleavage/methylation domain-containing protein